MANNELSKENFVEEEKDQTTQAELTAEEKELPATDSEESSVIEDVQKEENSGEAETLFNLSEDDAIADAEEQSEGDETENANEENSAFADEPLAEEVGPDVYDGPFVSVIIPVYNKEKYIDECISSVKSQTLKNIEIICINDGSTDNSLAMLLSLAETDDRIKVINREHCGAAAALNCGIEMAVGHYTAFLGADDFYPVPDVLEVLYKGAINNDVDIVGGSFSDLDGTRVINSYTGINSSLVFAKNEITDLSRMQFDGGYQRFIYNTAMLQENGILFPNYTKNFGLPFLANALLQADKVYLTKKFVYRHRKTVESDWSEEEKLDALLAINENIDFALTHDLSKLYSVNVGRVIELTDEYLKKLGEFRIAAYLPIYNEINSKMKVSMLDTTIVVDFEPNYILNKLLNKIGQKTSVLAKDLDKQVAQNQKLSVYKDCVTIVKDECEKNRRELAKVSTSFQNVINDNKRYLDELTSLQMSVSYRLGRFITWLPRKLKRKKK